MRENSHIPDMLLCIGILSYPFENQAIEPHLLPKYNHFTPPRNTDLEWDLLLNA
jgi:hypothetical protein